MPQFYTIEACRGGRVVLAISDRFPDDQAAIEAGRALMQTEAPDTVAVYRFDHSPEKLIAVFTIQGIAL